MELRNAAGRHQEEPCILPRPRSLVLGHVIWLNSSPAVDPPAPKAALPSAKAGDGLHAR